jgi:hypothetical protein
MLIYGLWLELSQLKLWVVQLSLGNRGVLTRQTTTAVPQMVVFLMPFKANNMFVMSSIAWVLMTGNSTISLIL